VDGHLPRLCLTIRCDRGKYWLSSVLLLMKARGTLLAPVLAASVLRCDATSPNVDRLPPVVQAVVAPSGAAAFVPTDTLQISVTGSDETALAWIGYELGSPAGVRDSAAVSGTGAQHSFRVALRAEWAESRISVSAIAQDAGGNRGTRLQTPIEVINAVRRPMVGVRLPAQPYDVAYDAPRGRLYVSIPDSNRLVVVDLASRSLAPPILLWGRPWGLDLTPSGDSLVVALRRGFSLALVNLLTGFVDTLALNMTGGLGEGPARVCVMKNRKVLYITDFDGFGYGNDIRKFDLQTRADSVVFAGFGIDQYGFIARDQRREYGIVLDNRSASFYSAISNSFGSVLQTTGEHFPSVAADSSLHWLVGNTLYDRDLNLIVNLHPPGYEYGPTAFSPDGRTAFLAAYRSYFRVPVPSAVGPRVFVPLTPQRLWYLADRDVVVATTYDATSSEWRVWLIGP